MEKAKKLGIPYLDTNKLLLNIDHLEFTIPKTKEAKEEHIANIVQLSLVNGELHDNEH